MKTSDCFKFEPADIAEKIPGPDGEPFAMALQRGQLYVELYRPQQVDRQQPHSRDECYIVVEGEGRFQMGGETVPFKPGDFLFVPAGVEHRFLDFGESMATWVIFYGPEGGEQL